MAIAAQAVSRKTWNLEKETELRVEVGDVPVKFEVIEGSAEIFGTELPLANPISFPPGHKFAVFTWNGATLEMEGEPEVAYTAQDTPMVSYVNVHGVLEQWRQLAKQAAQPGPRVMLVGPTDSGKSSVCNMLLGWAARLGWEPMYVDLDVGQGNITIPGTISAIPVNMPIDPIYGVAALDTLPLVYFYGHVNPSANTDLYRVIVKELASNARAGAEGMIINTMSWVDGVGFELLLQAVEAFEVTVVMVLGQEKLCNMLQDALKTKAGVGVVKLHKSGGVVSRNREYRQQGRVNKTKDYFYGTLHHVQISAHLSVANFSDLRIFRIGSGPQAPRSALPIGAQSTADPTRVVPVVSITRDLIHSVLAVSYAKEPQDLITSHVAGFLHVTDVDLTRKTVSYVAPCPGSLPNNLLLVGTLTWVE